MLPKLAFVLLSAVCLASGSDVFDLRTFSKPDVPGKAKLDLNRPFDLPTITALAPPPKVCAIPLLSLKADNKFDPMAKNVGPIKGPGVMAPPVPACKNWN